MAENVDIGSRLREERLAQGVSLRHVAREVGVSPSFISQVENGKTRPSVSTLYEIVNVLGVSLDDLMGHSPRQQTPPAGAGEPGASVVQRAADNPALEMSTGVRWERLAVGEGGPADAFLVTYEPHASGSADGALTHHAGVEYGYILEGALTLRLEDEQHVLGPGDSVHFDSMRPHVYLNHGDVPARGVWFVLRAADAERAPGPADHGSPASPGEAIRAMDRL